MTFGTSGFLFVILIKSIDLDFDIQFGFNTILCRDTARTSVVLSGELVLYYRTLCTL